MKRITVEMLKQIDACEQIRLSYSRRAFPDARVSHDPWRWPTGQGLRSRRPDVCLRQRSSQIE